ncbi:aromatic amino acid lyase [Pseudobacteriovorax antillogorgiicola]|uniref:Histidine ammonia-lyase n=1 Tax=Pseudobacteriovorax antillogorgiicola TaxID=1513793 RepID=A0A1Y6BET7_9BACT|nr:aromatic amino acid lyase [Pseudobacteriovorax antillogorgiicola]TCS57495.1 histidine ammonia-lyase [Pseudobacteriovorax antillogorgiicola]SMF00405.1 Histidine ammonia-lyase [Pseudobacteriovorax antillogorgiicola]
MSAYLDIDDLGQADVCIESISHFSRDLPCNISKERLSHCLASYETLVRIAGQTDKPCYGLHTSYGHNVKDARNAGEFEFWQRDLLHYLQVGVGSPLPVPVVRLGLRLQAFKASRGVSGIHPETISDLLALSNEESLPLVPRYGSLGASGDLIPMAHALVPLFSHEIRGPRDVIGLVNTNAMMASWLVLQLQIVEQLWFRAAEITAINALVLDSPEEHFQGLGFEINSHLKGNCFAASQLAQALQNWRETLLIESKQTKVQSKYSIRCSPQILGNCYDLLEFAKCKAVSEALAVADNPIIPHDGDSPWHGGLFYASGLATGSDLAIDIVAKLCELLDRQVLLMMDGNETGLADNLWNGHDHLKGLHQLLSSLYQKVRTQTPRSIQASFSSESHNQDLVPAGMTMLVHLDELMALARDVFRGASFIALRGGVQKSGRAVPPALSLIQWQNWNLPEKGDLLSRFHHLTDS